mgnify:CR=1 FL=1
MTRRRLVGFKVKIVKALHEHTGKKYARMPKKVRDEIGVRDGGQVVIEGPKGMILRRSTKSLREESDDLIVGIDERDRDLIGVTEGKQAVVRKPTADDLETEQEPEGEPTWLFCYGSNNPQRLGERLGRPIEGVAAYLPGYERVFRGFSKSWGCGVASLEPTDVPQQAVYGYATHISVVELERLDLFEGVGLRAYQRKSFRILLKDGGEKYITAYAYVSTSGEFNAPSRSYLDAIVNTIAPFWREADGRKVTIRGIPIRN